MKRFLFAASLFALALSASNCDYSPDACVGPVVIEVPLPDAPLNPVPPPAPVPNACVPTGNGDCVLVDVPTNTWWCPSDSPMCVEYGPAMTANVVVKCSAD